jgi:hypothetical protein
MLASNLLEKIADGKLDVVAGTEQLFLMMRTAKMMSKSADWNR